MEQSILFHSILPQPYNILYQINYYLICRIWVSVVCSIEIYFIIKTAVRIERMNKVVLESFSWFIWLTISKETRCIMPKKRRNEYFGYILKNIRYKICVSIKTFFSFIFRPKIKLNEITILEDFLVQWSQDFQCHPH